MASVPVVGSVTLVGAVEVNVTELAPEVAKVDPAASVRVPVPVVIVLPFIVLLVRASVPANVAKTPVTGKVTFEPAAFAFNVVFAPVRARVKALFIPVPPLFDVSTPVTSAVERSMALQAGVAPARRKVFGPPTGSRVPEPAGLIYIISPAVVIGDKASNAAAFVVAPVPPLAKATTPVTFVAEVAFH